MRAPTLALITALALVLGACSPSSQTSQPSAPPAGGSTAPSGGAAASPAAAGKPTAPSAVGGQGQAATTNGAQEITVNALQGEPDNLDPSKSSFATEAAVIRQVFEPLLRFDKDLKPQPAATASMDVSQDGKTYTFKLRPDGKFSDGTPVTAQNFVYSFRRILDPKTASEYGSFFADAGIVGAKDFSAGKGTAEQVGVRAVDDRTLEIKLDNPIGYFPNLAALWVVAPLREDIITKAGADKWATDPSTYIGNGPFKLSEWIHQDRITLVPNPNYAGTKPTLQKVTFLMVSDASADYAAYMAGERDWTLVPDANVAQVRNDPNLKSQLKEYTELTTFWVHVNNARKPVDNPLVRKAFSRAIDRQALIRDIASDVGKPATSLIPPGMPGYQEGLGKDFDFNASAAKELLSQAGFANGQGFPTLTFRFATSTANQRRAEFIQAQLKQNLGITINLESMETKAYQAAYKAKDYDLAFGGWGADYPDPQNWMMPLFGCEASNNKWNYCNKQFDDLARQADQSTDQAKRLQLYGQAQQLLINDMPVVPLFYRGRAVVVKPWVQNLTLTAKDDYPGIQFLEQISVNKR